MGADPSHLLAYSQGNSVTYGANTWGQWVYTTGGETTYIENASFSPIFFYVNNCQTPEPHGYVGILNHRERPIRQPGHLLERKRLEHQLLRWNGGPGCKRPSWAWVPAATPPP